jgi:hypothetical protein
MACPECELAELRQGYAQLEQEYQQCHELLSAIVRSFDTPNRIEACRMGFVALTEAQMQQMGQMAAALDPYEGRFFTGDKKADDHLHHAYLHLADAYVRLRLLEEEQGNAAE